MMVLSAEIPPPAALPALPRLPREPSCALSGERWQRGSGSWRGDHHRISLGRTGCQVEAEAEGEVELSPYRFDVTRLGAGAFVQLVEVEGETERRVRITAGSGGLPLHVLTVDGRERPFDAAAREWTRDLLASIVSSQSFLAGSRVRSLLGVGGVEAVLAELDRLSGAGAMAHVFELLQAAELDEAQAVRLVETTGAAVSEGGPGVAGATRVLLDALPDAHLRSPRVAELYVEASRAVRLNDPVRAGALLRVLRESPLTPSLLAELLASAEAIQAPASRAEVLGAAARRLDTEELLLTYLEFVGRLPEGQGSASSLGPRPAGVSGTAGGTGGSSLPVSLRRSSGTPAGRETLRRQALEALLHPPHAEAVVGALIRGAAEVQDDQERLELLMAIARGQPLEGDNLLHFLEVLATTPIERLPAANLSPSAPRVSGSAGSGNRTGRPGGGR